MICEIPLLIFPDKKVPPMVDEFNWCFCSVIQEEMVSAAKIVLISDPIYLVFYSCGEVVGVLGSNQDVEVRVIGKLDIY
jgi:hypothetical protein